MKRELFDWDALPDNPLLPGPNGTTLTVECSNWIKENFGKHGPFPHKGKALELAVAAFEAGRAFNG